MTENARTHRSRLHRVGIGGLAGGSRGPAGAAWEPDEGIYSGNSAPVGSMCGVPLISWRRRVAPDTCAAALWLPSGRCSKPCQGLIDRRFARASCAGVSTSGAGCGCSPPGRRARASRASVPGILDRHRCGSVWTWTRKSNSTLLRQRRNHVVAQVVGRHAPERHAGDGRDHLGARRERVHHRLALAEQIRHAAPVAGAERVVLGLVPQALHEEIEQVRVERIEEVEHRHVAEAPDLELGILAGVRGDEGRRAHAHHVLGALLILEELGAGTSMIFMAMLTKPTSRISSGRFGPAGEAHVRRKLRGRGKMPRRMCSGRSSRMRLGAHDAMGLGVAAALGGARPVGPPDNHPRNCR